MKKFFASSKFVSLLLLLALVALLVLPTAGCGTNEPENLSERPWNSPASWETGGLPSSMNEGR